MFGLLSNVWHTRISIDRSGYKLHKSSDRKSMGTIRCAHTSHNGVPPPNRRHHRTSQSDNKTMLTQFVNNQKQDNWNTKLEKLSFAYNTAVHAVTKFSPFELIFGRIPKLPIDLVYDQTDANRLRRKLKWSGSPPTSWTSKGRK